MLSPENRKLCIERGQAVRSCLGKGSAEGLNWAACLECSEAEEGRSLDLQTWFGHMCSG